MKGFVTGVLTTLVVGAGIGLAVVYGGKVDVAADSPHSDLIFNLLEIAREKSIDQGVKGLSVPINLADKDRIRRGAGNYDAMCVSCHLAPGMENSEIRMGLYPTPPNLSTLDEPSTEAAARKFWVIKHGIKASGMPAWSKGGIEDEAIWDMVALLQVMPKLTQASYGELVEASEGHSHGGLRGGELMHGQGSDVMTAPAKVNGRSGHDNSDGHAH
ncbi:MAG: c-type cytochrome [Thiobacillus sp.]